MTDKDTFAEVVDVTLYRYNSIDNKIWGILKRDTRHKKISDDSIIIRAGFLKQHLLKNFKSDLNRVESMGSTIIHKEATSVYFLWSMLQDMLSLRWVKFTLNKNLAYNRIIEVDDIKTIRYSIKVMRGTIRLFEVFDFPHLYAVNAVLNDAGIFPEGRHFVIIKSSELVFRLEKVLTETNAMEVNSIVATLLQHLSEYESDNPDILLVTDY